MNALSQPLHLKISEAKIVSPLRSSVFTKPDFFTPNTAPASRSIYSRFTGGATVPERRRMSGAAMATSNVDATDDRIARIASTIRVIPDFPKPGILFQDITTLLLDHKAFKDTIDLFVERYKDKNINVIAGIEARGFIFGPPIALAIGAKFVPMRKPKKLPGEVISEEYSLEYGTDIMEMHVGAVQPGENAVVVDDLIATGGTLNAAISLLGRVGVTVVECACVIELKELKGREKLGDNPLFVLVS
ncbi:adenine phosphoribosyltransferase 1-like isoform X2 [Salvia splendens]|uniref:adenine phosphoribosyltransferase 1-like isoform X2 n=1 Tax=Salvia splendens TaxID=180675 RepID=UPI001C27BE27|nr:adenine phosphoribosyltransferase 1-like isoform X2 [Salvia splendens]